VVQFATRTAHAAFLSSPESAGRVRGNGRAKSDADRALNRIHHSKSAGWRQVGKCSTTELYRAFEEFVSSFHHLLGNAF
jgi:hypothetical protein